MTDFSTLSDPCNDRHLSEKECAPLVNRPISDEKLFRETPIDWKLLRDYQSQEGIVSKSQIVKILQMTSKQLSSEPNMVKVDEPICVVGDIHG